MVTSFYQLAIYSVVVFLDKSNSQGSRKGKSLAPTNSNKGIQVRVEGSEETTENVPSRANKRQQVKNEIPS